MLPTAGGPATDLGHLYRTLRPEPLIEPDELKKYYRSQVNQVRGEDTVVRLSLKLQQAYGTLPFKAFVMGHPGVGKSTEMSRLLESRQRSARWRSLEHRDGTEPGEFQGVRRVAPDAGPPRRGGRSA